MNFILMTLLLAAPQGASCQQSRDCDGDQWCYRSYCEQGPKTSKATLLGRWKLDMEDVIQAGVQRDPKLKERAKNARLLFDALIFEFKEDGRFLTHFRGEQRPGSWSYLREQDGALLITLDGVKDAEVKIWIKAEIMLLQGRGQDLRFRRVP